MFTGRVLLRNREIFSESRFVSGTSNCLIVYILLQNGNGEKEREKERGKGGRGKGFDGRERKRDR